MIFIANWKMNGDFKDILKVKIVSKLLSLNNFKKNKYSTVRKKYS